MSTHTIARESAGIPTGGQFAATSHSESTITLAPLPVSDFDGQDPTERYQTAAAQTIPKSLLMSHSPSDGARHNMTWEVDRANPADRHDMANGAMHFGSELDYLHPHESSEFFHRAVAAREADGSYGAVIEEALQANSAAHPGPKLDPSYAPAGGTVEPGYGQGTLTTGGKYAGWRPITEIAKDTRTDFKAAQKAGYLPAAASFSVRSDKFSGGQALRIGIKGVPREDRMLPGSEDRYGGYEERGEFKELSRRVEEIATAWNRSDIDSQSDYFNSNYYTTVQYED